MSIDLMADYESWLLAANASRRTIDSRMRAARRLLATAGVTDPRLLSTLDVTRFVASVPAANSRATYYGHAAALARFLEAIDGTAPAFMRGVPVTKAPRGIPRPISVDELSAALAVATLTESAMIRLAAFAGLRVSEIANVRGEDVGESIFVRGKGGRDAMVPTHPHIAAAAALMPSEGYWFPNRSGHPIGRVTVWTHMKRPLIAIGSTATPHQLRHWYGSELLRRCGNLRTVQELLRHASSSTTQIYTQVSDDDRRRAVDALPRIA